MTFQPELLTFLNGEPVTAENWSTRRQELLAILSDNIYGRSPAAPATVVGTVTGQERACCSGHAVLETVEIAFNTEKGRFTFPLRLFVPKKPGKHPLILLLNFRENVYDQYCPAEEIVDNGFALGVVCYSQITADNGDMSDGLAGMYSRQYSWGKIGMWAWGASRALDYLVTRPEVDAARITVIGHSRLGKAALWCAAQDERVACVCSNDSGCAGAAYERLKGPNAETVAHITKTFPYWFCETYAQYAGQPEAMPFDQHFLLAAVAPRFVSVASASEDAWADPYAEQLCCVAASPAWKLAGVPGFVGEERPAAVGESWLDGHIGYFLRDGIHFLGRGDWLQHMAYIKRHI